MRRAWIVLAAVLLAIGLGVGGVGIAPAGAKTSKPVQVDGKVNVKGTKDISSKKSASIEIEADDYYFEPTFVKVQPGEKVRITLENEGKRHAHVHVGRPEHRPGRRRGQEGEVQHHRPERRHRVRVPLRLPPEHGDAGRVLHEGGWHRE